MDQILNGIFMYEEGRGLSILCKMNKNSSKRLNVPIFWKIVLKELMSQISFENCTKGVNILNFLENCTKRVNVLIFFGKMR